MINQQALTRYAAVIAAYLIIAFGCSVLIGWHTHTEALIRFEQGIIAIVYNTALCFIISGIAILALIYNVRYVSQVVGCLLLFGSIAVLLQHVISIDLGTDQLFFEHYTAVCFILSAMVLLLLSQRKQRESIIIICNALSVLILSLALLFVFGYLTEIQDTYAWGVVTPMSFNAAIGFIILSISLLSISIYHGLIINANMLKATPIIGFMCIFIITILAAFKANAYESMYSGQINFAAYILVIGGIFAIKFGFLMHTLVSAKDAEMRSKRALSLMQATLDATADGLLAINTDGSINNYNKKFIEMWEVPVGKTFSNREELINFLISKVENKEFFLLNIQRVVASPEQSGVGELQLKNGNVYECSVNPQFLDAKIAGRVWSFRDVTMQKKMESELARQATYDSLTDLPNKALMLELVARSIKAAKYDNKVVGVLLIDIDNFSHINDLFSRNNGDALLKIISEKIKSRLSGDSVVGRIGGDQFLVLTGGLSRLENSATIINNIMQVFAKPYDVHGHELMITACVGVAFYPKDGADAETLIGNADIAKLRTKQDGRNKFQFYNKSMNYYTIQQIELESQLHKAVEQNQFVVHYQPIINLASDKIIGAEALVRWNHPEKGLIPPLDFIQLAENLGLIQDIGEMVLEIACTQAKAWHDQGRDNFKIAVNISAHQFKYSHLEKTIKRVLAKTGMAPSNLELELTEGILIESSDAIKATILNLSAMGISISLDDFGTGYSSLNYLKKFSIDKLKIDRTFINDLNNTTSGESLVQAIVAMGKSLKLTVLAEGVETKEQLEIVKSLGCDQAQGFYFARPIPAEDFTKMLNFSGN